MWKTIAFLCLTLGLGACASAPPVAEQPKSAAVQPPLGCVPNTASRLPPNSSSCTAPGSSYSKDQIDRTGQPYLNQSLQMLDPAITSK
jgi:hypothetical protein